jgi:hypothetical protein
MAEETSRKHHDFPPARSATSGAGTGLSGTATTAASAPTVSTQANERPSPAELGATAQDWRGA